MDDGPKSEPSTLTHVLRIGRWLDDGRVMAGAWVTTHALALAIWHFYAYAACCDVHYYWTQISRLQLVGPQHTLTEYPTPVIWIMQIPWWISQGEWTLYHRSFDGLMMLLDGVFAIALWRAGGTRRVQALLFWLAFPLLLGPIAYMRFDMIPAVLVGASLLTLGEQRHRVSGALTGIGAAIKLWPAALWPVLLVSQRKGKLRASIWFLGTAAALALVSLKDGGWGRLISPLQYQEHRGLQIESIWATVPMLLRGFQPRHYPLSVHFGAWQIAGPGVQHWMTVASIMTIIGGVMVIATYVAWLTRGQHTHLEAGLMVLLVVTYMVVANKTLSPQYWMWIGPPTAALVSMLGEDDPHGPSVTRREVAGVAAWVLGIAALTQAIFPRTYHPLTHGGPWFHLATAVLVARNLALLMFAAWLLRLISRHLRVRSRAV